MQYIQLAGTNAKGSTAQYLAEIIAQEYRCGLFTSPHMITPYERMRINGKMISAEEYEYYMKNARGDGSKHLFCVWTEAANAWFLDHNVEYAVLEAGLGGRLDPTNVYPSRMQILTPISYDHMELLGNTLEKIAWEKAGIIKQGSVVLSHPQKEEAMQVIRKVCREKDAQLIVLKEEDIHILRQDLNGQEFSFSYCKEKYTGLQIHAVSPMQIENACVALMAAVELGMAPAAIRQGLERMEIPARVQIIGDVVIDGAHNPAAMEELESAILRYYPDRDVTVLTAMMRDKDPASVSKIVGRFADQVLCTCVDPKRGLPAEKLATFFDDACSVPEPEEAFAVAQRMKEQKKGILVVCGSFYLAADVLRLLAQSH
ncbi:MAG: Mur ligase family protein [Christensenella sp.]|nr:Mur ligase family protein [Christensenella sp.]